MPNAPAKRYRLNQALLVSLMERGANRPETPALWTPREIAEALREKGIKTSTRSVQTWIDGTRAQPRGPTLVALAEVLGTKAEDLIE
jgi:hypothetical protein